MDGIVLWNRLVSDLTIYTTQQQGRIYVLKSNEKANRLLYRCITLLPACYKVSPLTKRFHRIDTMSNTMTKLAPVLLSIDWTKGAPHPPLLLYVKPRISRIWGNTLATRGGISTTSSTTTGRDQYRNFPNFAATNTLWKWHPFIKEYPTLQVSTERHNYQTTQTGIQHWILEGGQDKALSILALYPLVCRLLRTK